MNMLKNKNYPIALFMLQPAPLPGSYRHTGDRINKITDDILREADLAIQHGFDGFILQNMNDMPVKQIANPEAIAYMSVIGMRLKEEFPEAVLGILVNWDGVAALAVADAVLADFMRVEHLYTGAEVTSAGILEGQCCEICAMRKRIATDVPVFADVYERHGVPLGIKPMADAAWEAVNEAFADGLFISGETVEESIRLIESVRKKVGDVPVFLGGGATGDNVCKLLQHYDGVSVATWVKNGDMKNPIDPVRAKFFMDEVRRARDMIRI